MLIDGLSNHSVHKTTDYRKMTNEFWSLRENNITIPMNKTTKQLNICFEQNLSMDMSTSHLTDFSKMLVQIAVSSLKCLSQSAIS